MNAPRRLLYVVAFLALFVSSCAPPAPPQTGQSSTQPAVPPAEEQVTLTVWDVWARPEESAVIEGLNAQFEAAHPGVTINRVVKSFEDMKATAKLALSNADGPDIAQVNQGWSDMGAMVAGGLLENLTPYAEQYGWFDKISPSLIARNSFTADGKNFGEGNLYGVPPTAELVGVYYRKDIFADLGLDVPKTFGEFEADLAKVKEAGYTPLVFGNLEGWPAIHVYTEILNTMIDDRSYLDDLIYAWGKGASWDTPAVVNSAAKLVEWVDKGYFTPGFEGISYDDASAMFNNGEGAMTLAGSWLSSTFAAGPNADKIGFFLVPPATEGGYKMSVGGTSLAYAVRAGSPNADLAAAYIDWMMSDTAANAWAKAGTVPVSPVDPSILQEGTLFTDLVMAWNHMNANDEVGHYLDWATPTFYDTITAALQEVMAKQITPEEFAQKLEADHAAFLKELGK